MSGLVLGSRCFNDRLDGNGVLSCSTGDENANLIEVGDWRVRVAKASTVALITESMSLPLFPHQLPGGTQADVKLTSVFTHPQAKAEAATAPGGL